MNWGLMSSSMFPKPEVTWAQALVLWSSLWLFTMSSMLLRTGFCGMLAIRFQSHLASFGSHSYKYCEQHWDYMRNFFDIWLCIFYFDSQSYPHKILTGRRDMMHTMRQTNGLAGFTKRSESEYDCFGTGHSSTTISAGLGNYSLSTNH